MNKSYYTLLVRTQENGTKIDLLKRFKGLEKISEEGYTNIKYMALLDGNGEIKNEYPKRK